MVPGPCTNIRPAILPIGVVMPNGTKLLSTHTCQLPFPQLPTTATTGHVLPGLSSFSLVSIGLLCDAGCIARFDKDKVEIRLRNKLITTGTRTANGLWEIVLSAPPTPRTYAAAVASTPPATMITVLPEYAANYLRTKAHQTASERIAFLHAAAGYPVLSTWLAAIKLGFFATWPGITVDNVKRFLPKSPITPLGHLDQQRQNTRSTKTKQGTLPPAHTTESPIATPTLPQVPTKGHVMARVVHPASGKHYSDLPGRFLAASSLGNKYLLVVHDVDSNAILAEPMHNNTRGSILGAYQKIVTLLRSRGIEPALHILDNEASRDLKVFMQQKGIVFQLVPPGMHRVNAAERHIRTFANHFITILCGCDPTFPIYLWDKLLHQTLLTLNLLRRSNVNPLLSSQAQLHGAFDYNRTPIGPLGCSVLAHEKPTARATWAPHAVPAWYIGPATEHYRCYRTFAKATRRERIADTIEWQPIHTPLPRTSSTDDVLAAAQDLITALHNPTPAHPFAGLDPEKISALKTLSDIFKATTPDPPPLVEPPAPLPRVAPAAPLPRVAPSTYAEATSNPAQRRRREKQIQQQTTKTVAFAPVIAPVSEPVLPLIVPVSEPVPSPLATPKNALLPVPIIAPIVEQIPTHSHNTRSRKNGGRFAHAANHLQQSWYTSSPFVSGHLPVANAVVHPTTGKTMTYRQLVADPTTTKLWTAGCANEIARLAQGRKGTTIQGTDTIHFIAHHKLPAGRKATYLNIVVDYRPQKEEPNRVRFTVGGNLIDYPGNVSTPTCDMVTAKLVMNSTISTPNARFHCFDIGNFYLNTPMDRYEYMRIPIWAIPDCIMEEYKLKPLIHNGHVLVEIRKGMYGLPQAGQLAYERLVKHLAGYGYAPTRHTPGLWKHTTRPILFSLCVDDFGIKTVGRQHADHLLAALRDQYPVTTDWSGSKYLGITIEWDYPGRKFEISMPGTVAAGLHRFQHPTPTKPEDSPHAWNRPQYGVPVQLSTAPDESPLLDAAGITRIQQIVGYFQHYARAIDNTMLVALSSLASQQARSTEATASAITQFLNYCATHPDAKISFHASDMILAVSSDASYNSEPKAKSRVAGYMYLSTKSLDPTKAPTTPPPINGPINIVCNVLTNVMSSAAEAEMGGLFYNAKEAVPIRTTLEEMDHPQPATPIETDNACATGIANSQIRQKRSKSMDMRFYWVQDRVRQNQFIIYWGPGRNSIADYYTKHHPASHHRDMRPTAVHIAKSIQPTTPSSTGSGKGVFISGTPDPRQRNQIPIDQTSNLVTYRTPQY